MLGRHPRARRAGAQRHAEGEGGGRSGAESPAEVAEDVEDPSRGQRV